MPHSHHSHSGAFCRHARDDLPAVVAEAARQGFAVYGLSEHAPRYRREDMFPEEADLSPAELADAFSSFLSAAHALRASAPSSSPALLIGVETDYITALDLARLPALLADARVEYAVGSVHHVGGISIDLDRGTWLRSVRDFASGEGTTMRVGASGALELAPALGGGGGDDARLAPGYTPGAAELAPWLAAYLDAQHTLLCACQPEVVGHFDLCLLWTPHLSLADPAFAHAGVWDRVVRNVEYVVGYGGLFEANAAALRKGWDTGYPGRDVLQLILDRGGRLCLSDDSHGVAQVGLNYGRLRAALRAAGVAHVWHLVRAADAREGDVQVGPRGRVVARRVDDWAEGGFWDARDGR